MNRLKSLCLAVLGAGALAACGGAKTANDIQDHAPTFGTAAMDMEASDASGGQSSAALTPGDTCHPHLFLRTRHVVHRLNWHLFKTLFVMDKVIAEHPDAKSGSTATWTRTGPKYALQIVGTKTSDTEYGYDISVKAKADPDSAYKLVTHADVTVTGSGATAEQKGTIHSDFSAFSSVIKEDKSQGTLDYTFDVSGNKKDIEVKLQDFLPDDDLAGEVSPRDAHYVFERNKGVGGSLKYTDELILACPEVNGAPNTTARSSVETTFRWTKKADGSFVARGDTLATADSTDSNPPNIPNGDRIVGVTCGQLDNGDVEKYWMMKAEDSSGATLVSGTFTFDSQAGVDATAACDPQFGAIPTTDSAADDYDFSKVSFSDSSVVAYPGQ